MRAGRTSSPEGRPSRASSRRGRDWLAFGLALGLAASATWLRAGEVVARSALGAVRAQRFRREIERAARERPELGAWRSDAALARTFLEEWLFEEALAREGERLGLQPAAEEVEERRREVFARELERRLEAALVPPTDEQVEEFRRAQAALLPRAERLQLRHVFRRVSAHASPEERSRAREDLERLRGRIRDGADFGAVAREHSDSETAKFDGRLAPVSRGQLPAAVEAVVWGLGPGEMSAIVDTPVGFHVFLREENVPGGDLTVEQQRAWARHRLVTAARQAARARELERLCARSGALCAPQAAEGPGAAADAVVFSGAGETVTVGDLARRSPLTFAERRRGALRERAEEEVWRRVAQWEAKSTGRDREPELADALAAADRRPRAERAYARRLQRWQAALPEAEVRAFFASSPDRFSEPPRYRLRVIVAHRRRGGSPHAPYERLDELWRAIRRGERDMAEAARAVSEDPSAAAGGDLGFVEARDLSAWAGPQTAMRVGQLAPGELSPPLILDVYHEEQLGYVAEGYLLVRMEEGRPGRALSFEEARPRVVEALAASRAVEARQSIRAEVLRSVHARVYDDRLSRAAADRP